MDIFTAKARLRRLRVPLSAVVGALVSGLYVRQLTAYAVPLSLIAGCGLAVFGVVCPAVGSLLTWLSGETHRCPVPGCGFRVRLTGNDAGESRRWQETALAHPVHDRH